MKNCPICSSCNYSFIGENPDFDNCYIVKCKKCGFFYSTIEDGYDFYKYYKSEYREVRNEEITDNYLSSQKTRAMSQLNFIKSNINFKLENINILEIGCGLGSFLNEVNLNGGEGNKLYAFEADKTMYEYARSNIKDLNIINDVYKINSFEDNKFDLIFMSHVFEHIMNPNELLLDFNRILKPTGVLFLEVPNENFNSINYLINNQKGMGHLLFFDTQTLRKFISKFYNNIRINTYTYSKRKYIKALQTRKSINWDMSKKVYNGIHIRCIAGNINKISIMDKIKNYFASLKL